MKVLSFLFILSVCITAALADGMVSMPLKEVLPQADVIVLAEIITNNVTVVESKPEKGRASVAHTCSIKAGVIEEIKASAPKEMDLMFEYTVVEGVWSVWTGSGLEEQMKPKEKYVLLLASQGGRLQLLRAEKATDLSTIKNLLKQTQKDKTQQE